MPAGVPKALFGLLLCASMGCEAFRWVPGYSPDPKPEKAVSGTDFAIEGMPSPASFEASRAWRDLEFLAAEPRPTGTPGGARARKYIIDQLEALGLEVSQQEAVVEIPDRDPMRATNIAAVVPGASPDLVLLLAPYDSRHYDSFQHIGANDGASGAAVLLELARVIAAKPLPYTTWFVFLDGEAESSWVEGSTGLVGSRAFALMLNDRSALEQVRLAVFLNRVCDPDLNIARDLGSHRIYREEFWNVAARMGHEDVFPRDGAFETPEAGHTPLARAGLRRVVTLIDTSHGGESSPGPFSGTEDDDLAHCSEASLGIVGRVTIGALGKISERLVRIDQFSDSPVPDGKGLRFEHFADDKEGPGEAAGAPVAPGETPEVSSSSEPGESPEVSSSSESGETPEVSSSSEPGESPEVSSSSEPGETPEVSSSSEPGETPEVSSSSEPGESPEVSSSSESGESPEDSEATR